MAETPPVLGTPMPKGSRMGDEPEPDTNPGQPVDAAYFKKKLHAELQRRGRVDWLRNIAVAVGSVAAGVFSGVMFLDNRVQAQTDAGMARVTEKAAGQEARILTLEQVTRELRQEQYQYRKDTHDDLKELQNVMLSGQRSYKLDKPVQAMDAGR